MHFTSTVGFMSALLLSQVVPLTWAAPADAGRLQERNAQFREKLPYFEHKHQRVYRNDRRDEIEEIVRRVAQREANEREPLEVRTPDSEAPTSNPPTKPRLAVNGVSTSYANALSAPTVAARKVHGASINEPSSKYIDQGFHVESFTPELPESMLQPKIEQSLITNFPLDKNTGSLRLNSTNRHLLRPMDTKPVMSRDGGKGGIVNGHKIFIFDDTVTSTAPTALTPGKWSGFVSNSVAEDKGMKGARGKALVLEDKVGEWAGGLGTMRGFVPMTEGEQAYNLAMASQGLRYAVWPESSILPLDRTTGVIFAPVLYNTANPLHYTYLGSTLLKITVPGAGGPVAERISPLIFPDQPNEPEWGCLGGLRSFSAGPSAGAGNVYIFGNAPGGLMLGRVPASRIAQPSAYEFYHGNATWLPSRPKSGTATSPSAVFLPGAFSAIDVVYSPRHLTFLAVYQNSFADNTFYYKRLLAPHALYPPADGDDAHFVESVTRFPWSEERVLLQVPTPGAQFAYAGSVHAGYFDDEDFSRGGKRMLLGWTSPTGSDEGSSRTGYEFATAEIVWE